MSSLQSMRFSPESSILYSAGACCRSSISIVMLSDTRLPLQEEITKLLTLLRGYVWGWHGMNENICHTVIENSSLDIGLTKDK